MALSLGVRVEPTKIHYSVFDINSNEFVIVESLLVPQALNLPEALKYIRNNILDLIEEYNISLAAIRVTENNVKSLNVMRLYLEGVLLETFASNKKIEYRSYILSQLAKVFNCSSRDLKDIRDSTSLSVEIEKLNFDFTDFHKNEREAMFVSVAIASEVG